ncbi:carbohydrate ABC transporter permease [Agromyces binzhouensis]|uniref:carbohydrate ABC transporter permease n=1 Tax=Agromyces binzhouensis TaxID=1817495 RepID=UPI003645B715
MTLSPAAVIRQRRDAGAGRPAGTRARGVPYGITRWVLSAPLLAFLLAFVAVPSVYGLWISLTDRSIMNPNGEFVGLENFATVLRDAAFWNSLLFTVGFTVSTTALILVTGLALAVAMNRRFPGKKALFTVLLLPIMVAPALMGLMFRLTLNGDIGLTANLLAGIGLDLNLFAPSSVIPLLIVLEVAQWTPFVFLICYAGLQSLPEELYEAAALDGAGRWKAFTQITLPLMVPVLVTAAFLRGVDALRTFDVIYVLTGGGPGTTTTTMTIYIYKEAIVNGSFGVGTAASVVVLLVTLPLVPLVIKRIVTQPGDVR